MVIWWRGFGSESSPQPLALCSNRPKRRWEAIRQRGAGGGGWGWGQEAELDRVAAAEERGAALALKRARLEERVREHRRVAADLAPALSPPTPPAEADAEWAAKPAIVQRPRRCGGWRSSLVDMVPIALGSLGWHSQLWQPPLEDTPFVVATPRDVAMAPCTRLTVARLSGGLECHQRVPSENGICNLCIFVLWAPAQ